MKDANWQKGTLDLFGSSLGLIFLLSAILVGGRRNQD